MHLTRSHRRLVANFAAVLLLACQSAALAHACCVPHLQPAATEQAPCHDAAQDAAGAGGETVEGRCQKASASPSGLTILAADQLPAITLHHDRVAAVAAPAVRAGTPLLRVEPPPIAILHCCLRN